MKNRTAYKYFAFISYNSHDLVWGKRLQRKLEHYKMPATLCSQRGWKRTPINPVFFAPADIQPGGLTEELQERLKASRHLIVVCSPHSAKSKWVAQEIAYFHSLGRAKEIHFFIVEGEPHSGDENTECFNPIVEELGMPEILGANVNESVHRLPLLNRERAYVQLITKLLSVEFDDIWQRHRRLLLRKALLWSVGFVLVAVGLVGTWWMNRSVYVRMSVEECSIRNDALPEPDDVTIMMELENEVKVDTISGLGGSAAFPNIPNRFVGKNVRVTARCDYFIQLDTIFELSPDVSLKLYRDPDVYGHVKFRLYSAARKPLADYEVLINGMVTRSGMDGYVELDIPLSEQKTSYIVSLSDSSASGIITMPCGNYEVVYLK